MINIKNFEKEKLFSNMLLNFFKEFIIKLKSYLNKI